MVDFNRGIYAIAWAAFRHNYANFTGVVLILVFFDAFLPMTGHQIGAVPRFLLSSLIGLLAHEALLYGDLSRLAMRHRTRSPFFRFVLASFLLALPAAFGFGAMLAGREVSTAELALGIAVAMGIFGATLALFGSVLPAIVLGGRLDLVAAFARGRRVFWPTFLGLLAGPAAFWVLLLVGLVLLGRLGIPPSAYDPVTDDVRWLGGAGAILTIFGVVFANLLGAAVLCRAFYRGGGA